MLTHQGSGPATIPKRMFPKIQRYYMFGMVIMLFGLILTVLGTELVGLIFIIVGFVIGILSRIFRKPSPSISNRQGTVEKVAQPLPNSKQTETSKDPAIMIRCLHCGTTFYESYIKCPNCGAGHN